MSLQLSNVKVFGRNLDQGKMLRHVCGKDSIDLYFRSQENIISVIQNIRTPEDLLKPDILSLAAFPDVITDFEPIKTCHPSAGDFCLAISRKGMIRLYEVSKKDVVFPIFVFRL